MENIPDPPEHYGLCACDFEGCVCSAAFGPAMHAYHGATCENCDHGWHNDGQRECAACQEPCYVDSEDENMVLDREHTYHLECFDSLGREDKHGLILLGLID